MYLTGGCTPVTTVGTHFLYQPSVVGKQYRDTKLICPYGTPKLKSSWTPTSEFLTGRLGLETRESFQHSRSGYLFVKRIFVDSTVYISSDDLWRSDGRFK